jgi:hypothetical protein
VEDGFGIAAVALIVILALLPAADGTPLVPDAA